MNASDPQVSPDGKSVAVVVSRVNAKKSANSAAAQPTAMVPADLRNVLRSRCPGIVVYLLRWCRAPHPDAADRRTAHSRLVKGLLVLYVPTRRCVDGARRAPRR